MVDDVESKPAHIPTSNLEDKVGVIYMFRLRVIVNRAVVFMVKSP